MDDILLSVVIPAYNAENCIRDCLDALLKQTYTNLEIIIVDDGSKDLTLEVCKEYQQRDSRIKVCSQPNQGASVSRNKGIELATGDFITFCDADDYPDPELAENYIASQERWKEKDISFVVCGMYFDNLFNKNSRTKKLILESAYGYIEGECYLLNRSAAATLAWLKLFNFVTNKCYDLRKIKEHNIRFDEKIHIGEDLKFNLDYLDKCPGYIGMKNLALYHYVKRCDDSLCATYHSNDLDDTKCIYKRFVNWEASQPEVTEDNILVVKSIYITDWVNRLTTYYTNYKGTDGARAANIRISKEIRSKEFQSMLKEIYKARKISLLRYISLRSGFYEIFYFFRAIYQMMKG